MTTLATSPLISASAGLDPADRALLNLWVNRGFDDERLARLTGLSPDALQRRRERIVERLSEDLGLPADHVLTTLSEIAAAVAAPAPAPVNGRDAVPATPGLHLGPAALHAGATASAAPGLHLGPAALHAGACATPGRHLGPAALHPSFAAAAASGAPLPETPSAPEPRPRRARRRARTAAALLALAGFAAVAVVVVALSSGGSTPRPVHRPAGSPAAGGASGAAGAPSAVSTSTTATASGAPDAPAPVAPTAGGGAVALAGLPGGLTGAHGSVKLVGSGSRLKLRLTVSSLPTVRSGHYEAWLYNSVLDSVPLGRVAAGSHTVVFGLPARASRFRWIDISLQPPGRVDHSGESQLRAPDPARGVASGTGG